MDYANNPKIGTYTITRDGLTGTYFYDGLRFIYMSGEDLLDGEGTHVMLNV